MYIVSRVTLDGSHIGYMLDDSGFRYCVVDKGLYDQEVLKSLISKGYQFLNYHADVLMPDGTPIKSLVAAPFTGSEEELQTMYDMADIAMSEAEAATYFSRKVEVKEIDLFKSTNEIATREEFVAYLERLRQVTRYRTGSQDIRPINSFVAREALFTMEEVLLNHDIREYMKVIAGRRVMETFNDYNRLREFLHEAGAITSNAASPTEVVEGYLKWGIDGIATPIVNSRINTGVSNNIYDAVDNGKATAPLRSQELALMDKRGVIYYSRGTINLSELDSFDNEDVIPEEESKYFDLLHSTQRWSSDYSAIMVLVADYMTRYSMELLDSNGVTYKVKLDTDRMVFFDARGSFFSVEGWHIKLLSEMSYTIRLLGDERTYQRRNLLLSKAVDLIKAATVPVPVESSFQLLIKEGVTPEAAIRYIARVVEERPEFNGWLSSGISLHKAHILYRKGPDKALIRKYNPSEEEYSTIDELSEIMSATKEDMIERGEYLNYDKNAIDPENTAMSEEVAMRPIENLEFVRTIKNDKVAIDNFGAGRTADGMAEVFRIMNFLGVCTTVLLGNSADTAGYGEFVNAIRNVTDGAIVDIGVAMRQRTEAFYGYLMDRAILNSARAQQSTGLVYVTRVFRELSNAPISEQRHYMFECVKIPLNARSQEESDLKVITQAIVDAIKANVKNYRLQDVLVASAASMAATIMFKIVAKSPNLFNRYENGEAITVLNEYVPGADKDSKQLLEIKIPAAIWYRYQMPEYRARKYCTINDWCQYEMSANSAFNFYCINANINPWYVRPKDGFSISEYNFGINFVRQAALEASLSEGFRNKVTAANARVTELSSCYFDNSLLEGSVLDEIADYDLSNVETLLEDTVDESIAQYYKRFTLLNNQAKARGEYLKVMRLKSDVMYECYADFYGIEVPEEDCFEKMTAPVDAVQWLATFGVESVKALEGSKTKMLTAGSENPVYKFNIDDYNFEDIVRWAGLVSGDFTPSGMCIASGSSVLFVSEKGKVSRDLATLVKADADVLTSKGFMYQLSANKYLVITTSGKFVVEVA